MYLSVHCIITISKLDDLIGFDVLCIDISDSEKNGDLRGYDGANCSYVCRNLLMNHKTWLAYQQCWWITKFLIGSRNQTVAFVWWLGYQVMRQSQPSPSVGIVWTLGHGLHKSRAEDKTISLVIIMYELKELSAYGMEADHGLPFHHQIYDKYIHPQLGRKVKIVLKLEIPLLCCRYNNSCRI